MASPVSDQEGVSSILDTDLYKLTMQCALIQSGWGDVEVTYGLTNRTPQLKLTPEGFEWLKHHVSRLGSISLTDDELSFLRRKCPYFPENYLEYLKNFRLKPDEDVKLEHKHDVGQNTKEEKDDESDLIITITGTWAGTILYEIPLLVLISEAYFRFSDTDWDYTSQEEIAFDKAMRLLQAGCAFSEFGTRRRRTYKTQELVLRGLMRAADTASSQGLLPQGAAFTGTSNVHFAHLHDITPIGTVAHEWFMGIASITQEYTTANLVGIEQWVSCFGQGVLGIALTDTFGTEQFLKCFKTVRPGTDLTYAEIYTGVRQDSGDPEEFIRVMRKFYSDLERETSRKIGKKTIVFSDSLDVDLCLKYKSYAEKHDFLTSFGIGTFLTNHFMHLSSPGKRSAPMNIVIKLSSAAGNPAVKISDNIGKNTGDQKTVERVKKELGYIEKDWIDEVGGGNLGDESNRLGGDGGDGDGAGGNKGKEN